MELCAVTRYTTRGRCWKDIVSPSLWNFTGALVSWTRADPGWVTSGFQLAPWHSCFSYCFLLSRGMSLTVYSNGVPEGFGCSLRPSHLSPVPALRLQGLTWSGNIEGVGFPHCPIHSVITSSPAPFLCLVVAPCPSLFLLPSPPFNLEINRAYSLQKGS